MIKMWWKVDKSDSYNMFSGNTSFFIHKRTSSESEEVLLWIKNEKTV